MLSTLKYEGDRGQWTLEVLVTTELISIEKIVQLLEHQWKTDTGWTKTKQSGLDSHWSLQEKDGARWEGSLQVLPKGKDYEVSVSVVKK